MLNSTPAISIILFSSVIISFRRTSADSFKASVFNETPVYSISASTGINGISRFVGRVYRLVSQNADDIKSRSNLNYSDIKDKDVSLNYRLNLTVKRAGDDVEALEFNTAIAAIMELVNDLYKIAEENKPKSDLYYFALRQLALIISPFAPHLGEELWHMIGGTKTVFNQGWPSYDPQALELARVTMVVQINGRLRGSFEVSADITEDSLFRMAQTDDRTAKHLEGRQIVKKIFVPGKLLNIVVR